MPFASKIEELSQNYGKIFPHHFPLKSETQRRKEEKKKVKQRKLAWKVAGLGGAQDWVAEILEPIWPRKGRLWRVSRKKRKVGAKLANSLIG